MEPVFMLNPCSRKKPSPVKSVPLDGLELPEDGLLEADPEDEPLDDELPDEDELPKEPCLLNTSG
jgi:hypothetical protein